MNNDKKKSVAIGRALLSGPYLIWMIGFTIIPLALIFWYGITTKNGNLTLANITAIMSPDHWKALWLSLGLSLISTVLCLVLAYPLAMILRGRGSSASGFIVFIFILPMWMNFLLRTMAWQTLLERNGVINGILAWLHLPKQNLINTPAAIVLGMVYNFLPFMVLPIYNVHHQCRKGLRRQYFTDSVLYLAAFKPSRYYQRYYHGIRAFPYHIRYLRPVRRKQDPADR